MLFRARRATFEMMNFCCVFFKTCVRDRFNLESTFSCLLGESYIYEHDFLLIPHQMQDSHMNTTRTEVGRYCEIPCKVRACSHSVLFIIFFFDPHGKETKRFFFKKKLSDNFSSVV